MKSTPPQKETSQAKGKFWQRVTAISLIIHTQIKKIPICFLSPKD
jgi:hypothetical protein